MQRETITHDHLTAKAIESRLVAARLLMGLDKQEAIAQARIAVYGTRSHLDPAYDWEPETGTITYPGEVHAETALMHWTHANITAMRGITALNAAIPQPTARECVQSKGLLLADLIPEAAK